MDAQAITAAAALLWQHWSRSTRIAGLPAHCRPADRAEGYAIQAEVARMSGQRVAGWKIAATSSAGQRHIGVDGPLAGRLLSGRVLETGASVPVQHNLMRVAEAEFAFRLRKDLPPRSEPYRDEEVLDAAGSLHPAIEIPDSRYDDFAQVGGPQLIADTACACWFVLGAPAPVGWRAHDLAVHAVTAYRNGKAAAEGTGANVLGDPRIALAWIANELRVHGDGLRAGDVVTTGTCIVPTPIAPGDRIEADFGGFGRVATSLR